MLQCMPQVSASKPIGVRGAISDCADQKPWQYKDSNTFTTHVCTNTVFPLRGDCFIILIQYIPIRRILPILRVNIPRRASFHSVEYSLVL